LGCGFISGITAIRALAFSGPITWTVRLALSTIGLAAVSGFVITFFAVLFARDD
jgi:hypothetical protein